MENEEDAAKELMIYKPLPTEVRVTLQKQCRNLGSTSVSSRKEGGEFLAEYIQTRASREIEDLDTQLKKVKTYFNFILRALSNLFFSTFL